MFPQEHYLESSKASKAGTAAAPEAKEQELGISSPAAPPTKPMRQAAPLSTTPHPRRRRCMPPHMRMSLVH